MDYALIGNPLTHSFSEKYFTTKFKDIQQNLVYKAVPLQNIQQLNTLIESQPNLKGFNVTIPFKVQILPHLHELDFQAQAVGAVNCVSIQRHSLHPKQFILKGYNTDVDGFRNSLTPLLKSNHQQALILGDGGAAKAVKHALSQLNIPFKVVTRHKIGSEQYEYQELTQQIIEQHSIIINTTPLGTFPAIDTCSDIPYTFLTPKHLLYDLVYNPVETEFLRRGKVKGALTKNGYEMLILQAECSWDIWNANPLV